MDALEYNSFLKTRRTAKLFESSVIPDEHKQMLIDAANYAPAQNSNKNFIPILIEDPAHKEWLQDNIFYMVPKYSKRLDRDMPREYQFAVSTAPLVFLYLEASKNLPIVQHGSALDRNGDHMKEPDQGDLYIRSINIGLNMGFLANQAYMLGYDVGFVGCTRGIKNVMETPELRDQLQNMYNEYHVSYYGKKYGLTPGYAVCIGKATPVDNPQGQKVSDQTLLGSPYKDGYYTNYKKHGLNPIENVRVKTK
jgi:hypothetical protein